MIRRHKQAGKGGHYCLLVNREAAAFGRKPIDRLIRGIRQKGGRFTLIEPGSAMEMMQQAERMAKARQGQRGAPAAVNRWGNVSVLVACGGDSAFNLVGRAALAARLPMGALPMGRHNNIARAIYGDARPESIADSIVRGRIRRLDAATANDQVFFGSIGLGLVPELAALLSGQTPPRFGIGWSKLAARAAAAVQLRRTVLKIDAYRFEVSPIMLNINLLPYSVGLPISPASLTDDGRMEVIFDRNGVTESFSGFIRAIWKNRYQYDKGIGLYRGTVVSLEPARGRLLYLDGEIVKLPGPSLDIRFLPDKLKVLG
jgi:diacylglycerol kinase family enzyme